MTLLEEEKMLKCRLESFFVTVMEWTTAVIEWTTAVMTFLDEASLR